MNTNTAVVLIIAIWAAAHICELLVKRRGRR
jgi:hypothetical protein